MAGPPSRKKKSTSSSSRRNNHSPPPPSSSRDRHNSRKSSNDDYDNYYDNNRPDYDDDVEDSGRDTLKPLMGKHERELQKELSSRKDHHRSRERHAARARYAAASNNSIHNSRGERDYDDDDYNDNSGGRRSGKGGEGGGSGSSYYSIDNKNNKGKRSSSNGGGSGKEKLSQLGRFINDRSKNSMMSGDDDVNEAEFEELLADQTSEACSTITPPSVFQDMENDDYTDDGSKSYARKAGYANYRAGGGGDNNGNKNGDPPSADNGGKGISSSLRRFGYAGFRRNAARKSNTVNASGANGGGPINVNPNAWNSVNKGLGIGGNNNGSNKGGPVNNGTGVVYRSADSTHRALEELKRKRLEAQEKKRAITILCALILLAMSVHFVGRAGSVDEKSSANLKGSPSTAKNYGKTKDLAYGGERAGSSAGVGQYNLQPYEPGEGEDLSDEYELPPPQEKIYDEEHQFLLPLRHFADVKDPHRPTDTAFFFHVPRSGGSTMKDMIGKCLKLVQSSEVGIRDGHGSDPMLQVIEINESKYVNVDTTTVQGIQRAVDLGLATSGYADMVVSSYLHQSAALFDLNHQARAFIMLRNPIERATSMYYHRIHELNDLDASISLEDFAQGNGIENNWMTRFLTDRMEGELTKEDLEQAKEILKDKFMIGFLDDLEESVYRFMRYNHWKYSEDDNQKMKEEDCIRDLAMVGSNINPNEYELPKRGTQAYALITWQTQFDTKLYEYAKELFDSQTKTYGTKERKKMLKKQKKKGGKL